MKSTVSAVAVAVLLGASVEARAQTVSGNSQVFVSVNSGYQVTSSDFRDGGVFRDYTEDGRFETEYDVASGPTFDVSGAGQLWRWLGLGGGVSRFSRSTPAILTGSVPHPFFFDRPRSVGGTIAGLEREELSLHVQVRGALSVNGRLQLSLFGGPSWFRVRQEIVRNITYTEAYPYDEALFSGGTTATETGSGLGFNVGLDTAIFFTRRAGIGMLVQYSGAKVDLPSADRSFREVNTGGIQTGAGLRLRF